MVKTCADTDDLIGHKADLDISVIGMQQESAVLALHAGKTGADLHGFYSSQLIFDKKCPLFSQYSMAIFKKFRRHESNYKILLKIRSNLQAAG